MKKCLTAFYALLVATSVLAAEPTLDFCLNLALQQNPSVRHAQQTYEASVARIAQGTALPDPYLEVTALMDSDNMSRGISEVMLTQSFPWFGKLGKVGEVASAEAEAMFFAIQVRQLEISQEVADAFFDYAYLGRAIEVTQENLRLLNSLSSVVESAVSGGGALNDLLRIQVEALRLDDELRALEEALVSQQARLNTLMGREVLDELTIPALTPAKAPAPDLQALIQPMLEHHPRIQMLHRQIKSNDARIAVARLDYRPEFMAGISYMPDRSRMIMEQSDDWGVIVGVSVPIWRDKYHGAKREAIAEKRAAEAELESAVNELKAELSVALSQFRDAARRVNLFEDRLLPLARQALSNTEESYRTGSSTVLELIDSERSLLELELNRWRAIADLRKAQMRITLLSGVHPTNL